METPDYIQRTKRLTVNQARSIIIRCHEILDRGGASDAAGAPCDDPKCNSHLVHRVHELVDGQVT